MKDIEQCRYVDEECPVTVVVRIRGKIIKGMAMDTKVKRTM